MSKGNEGRKSPPDPKEAKLAQALRANLRRRKAGRESSPTSNPAAKD